MGTLELVCCCAATFEKLFVLTPVNHSQVFNCPDPCPPKQQYNRLVLGLCLNGVCCSISYRIFFLIFQGLMHGPPVSQHPHHNPPLSHQAMHQQQQQHHRQELPHHQHQQLSLNEPHPLMHHGENPFHHGSPRQMTPRPQNPQQRSMSNRQRMVSN